MLSPEYIQNIYKNIVRKHDIIHKTGSTDKILYFRQKRTEPRPQSTRAKNSRSSVVWFLRYATGKTKRERETDRQYFRGSAYWHFAAGGRQLARQRHRRDVGEAVGGTVEERVASSAGRREFRASVCAAAGRRHLRRAAVSTSTHRTGEPERIEAAETHTRVTRGSSISQSVLLARNVMYTSRAYATTSVSVCLWRKCIGAL